MGLLTLGFDPARFPAEPPACYRASWQLPGPDSHRQATTSLTLDQVYITSNWLGARNTEASLNAGNLGWFGWFGAGGTPIANGGATARDARARAPDGGRLGRPDDDHRVGWGQGRTRPVLVVATFDAEVGHLALDHAREGAQAAPGKQPLGDLAGDARQRGGSEFRGGWPPGRWW
jgi:hypothetical protein